MKKITLIFLVLMLAKPALGAASFTEAQAVRAVIGEASGEGYAGMLAVSCALRNRGTLKGVYGFNAAHVDREPAWVWDMAQKAWNESASHDVTNGATNWHNLGREGENYWTKTMTKTATIGQHVFYKK